MKKWIEKIIILSILWSLNALVLWLMLNYFPLFPERIINLHPTFFEVFMAVSIINIAVPGLHIKDFSEKEEK